jgi:uridylate kinase
MGMLATVMNALAMQNALEKAGSTPRPVRDPMATVSEPYIRRRAIRHMEKERVVIFAAGTGNPYFTTDTAAALRPPRWAATPCSRAPAWTVSMTPTRRRSRRPKRYETVGYNQVLADDLKVMDASAIALCRDNNIPIVVFNIREQGNLARVLSGEGVATIVGAEGE